MLQSEVAQVWGKNLTFGSGMWNVFVFFFFKHCYIIVQSGLKLYDCTILAAKVAPNMVKTEFELEQVISMQLRNKITVVRNIRIHHLN